MQVILIPGRSGRSRQVTLRGWQLLALAAVLGGALLYTGLRLGTVIGARSAMVDAERIEHALQAQARLVSDLETDRGDLAATTRSAREQLDRVARRLGGLQAHMIRVEALGHRLAKLAELDQGEFDFSSPPAVGGPERDLADQDLDTPEVLQTLETLGRRLDDRVRQLEVLQAFLLRRRVHAEMTPDGPPLDEGWVSSAFGKRKDPITGRNAWHEGVDFVAAPGSKVLAVASGVVIVSGRMTGYGLTVEIDHGNDFITRYAHNRRNLVTVGDTVIKGQAIALLGSTGRSTGPHVHFEVLHKGNPIDPKKFLDTAT